MGLSGLIDARGGGGGSLSSLWQRCFEQNFALIILVLLLSNFSRRFHFLNLQPLRLSSSPYTGFHLLLRFYFRHQLSLFAHISKVTWKLDQDDRIAGMITFTQEGEEALLTCIIADLGSVTLHVSGFNAFLQQRIGLLVDIHEHSKQNLSQTDCFHSAVAKLIVWIGMMSFAQALSATLHAETLYTLTWTLKP